MSRKTPETDRNTHRPSFAGALFVLAAGLALTIAGVAQAGSDQDAAAAFKRAWARVQAGETHAAQPDPPLLRHYIIYDYLVAARLRGALPQADAALDARIAAFLDAHRGQPVAEPLRRDWLLSLADRQQWTDFLRHDEAREDSDAELVCDKLQARLALQQTDGLAAAALARWQLPQDQPSACDPVFDWLKHQQLLSDALVEQRARAALAAGNARLGKSLAGDLPAARAAPLLQWAELLLSPSSTLPPLARPAAPPVERDALLQAYSRFAIRNPAQAAALYPGLTARSDLDADSKAQLLRMLALGEALDRDPGAVAHYRALPETAVDDSAAEWRVRAALWAGDYQQAHDWIVRMPPALAAQPRWRYWLARTVAATQGPDAAQTLYAAIDGQRDLYSYLAADRIDAPYDLNVHPAPDDELQQKALAALPGVQRAHALFDCALEDQANGEWAAALAGSDSARQIQAARLAARWGWYMQSIATLARAGEWDDVRLRYPRPYLRPVTQAAKLSGLPPDWIYAVMRQESLFRADAVSGAGARGLLQLLPSTAKETARRHELPVPTVDALFDPATAIPLGALHLRELYDHYGDQLPLTLAAYNAGRGNVARWLPARPIEADVWIENIPFNETRSYVQRILEHIVAFGWTADGKPPRLDALLTPVHAPDAES